MTRDKLEAFDRDLEDSRTRTEQIPGLSRSEAALRVKQDMAKAPVQEPFFRSLAKILGLAG